MVYTPRVTSSRKVEPVVELTGKGTAKLAAPDVAKSPPVGTVVHPVEGNPGACPGPVCEPCFPDGVEPGYISVGCEHGMWILTVD
jgi:hypothetical protein